MTTEVNSEETQVVEVLVSQPEVVETVKVVERDVDAKKEEKPIKEIEEKGQPVKEKEEGKLDEKKEEEKPAQSEGEAEEKPSKGVPEKEKSVAAEEGEEVEEAEEVNVDISLWGVPLLPSKGAKGTDVILLKFLRARDFKVNDAFEMLKNTLQWRKEFKIDSILDEDLGSDLNSVAYMNGVDREGHPVCYNIYGVFQNEELYQKTFGTEEKRNQFLRWSPLKFGHVFPLYVSVGKAKTDLGNFKRKDKEVLIDTDPPPLRYKKPNIATLNILEKGINIRSSTRLTKPSFPLLAKTSKHKHKRLVLKSTSTEKMATNIETEGQLDLAREISEDRLETKDRTI
ncbi:hypothetical protein NE237_031812 [Protea cynaroides]|uniref:CRAL/TRIO N-terminal domain-containing protein n=1 Tax=Protea cynaroides TaxID=273540 RepID=A0A9Q0L297_9MAGN|nr:hypothetical protein NE237_031812 [Protea cynaroides]